MMVASRHATAGLLLCAAALSGGCAAARQASTPPAPPPAASTPAVPSVPASGALLAPERIAALPAAERAAWQRYIERSRAERAADRAALEAEMRALGRDTLARAPVGPALVLEDSMTEEWFRSERARRVADHILSYQTPSGGWSKRLDLVSRPRQPGESFSSEQWNYIATFDNGATTEQLRFLARAYLAHRDPRHLAAYLRGLDYVIRAQFPNGCWPQVYPLQGGYHDAATYNDDATVNILRALREADGHDFVPARARARARAAVQRGTECILASQVVVDGRRMVWGAQHDPLTLQPVRARAYEHASLSGRESAAVVLFLMELEQPHRRVVEAVQGAVDWFNATAVHGYDYKSKGGLTARQGAGPLWARFYELGTNRPIFSNRDGIVRYRWDELEDERKFGYGWYTDEPQRVLRRYDRWLRRHTAQNG